MTALTRFAVLCSFDANPRGQLFRTLCADGLNIEHPKCICPLRWVDSLDLQELLFFWTNANGDTVAGASAGTASRSLKTGLSLCALSLSWQTNPSHP